MKFFEELKRRSVFRVAIAYVLMTWVVLQIIDILFEIFSVPGWVARFLTIMLALGFFPAVAFAWAFEITPEGIKPESQVDRTKSISKATARKLDNIIIALLLVSTGYFYWEARISSESSPATAEKPVYKSALAAPETPDANDVALDVDVKSIAVLPFVNMSSDPEQDYFSDGISEELLNVLTKLPNLHVAARTSSFQFRGENLDIAEIAGRLKVNHILEGSVRMGNDRLRVTAQLIEAESGYHLWSETYDRSPEDVLAIQDDISAKIADALSAQLVLRSGQTYTPRVPRPANFEAYQAFLKGRYLIHAGDTHNLTAATTELESAVELDPGFAPAHSELAIAILLDDDQNMDAVSRQTTRTQAIEHIATALALDPMQSEAHAAQSLLALQNEDYEAALLYADEAIRKNPAGTYALKWRDLAVARSKSGEKPPSGTDAGTGHSQMQ